MDKDNFAPRQAKFKNPIIITKKKENATKRMPYE